MIDQQLLIDYLEHFSYLGIFVVMMFAGYVIPMPEEILLLLVGYLAGIGLNNMWLAIAVSLLGLLTGDLILYTLSRTGSAYMIRLQEKFHPEKLARYQTLMRQRLRLAIFAFRFVAGLRFLGPFLAGSTNTSLLTFIIYDVLALLIYTPIFVVVGWHWHSTITRTITQIEILRHALTWAAMVGIGVCIWYMVKKRFFTKPSIHLSPLPDKVTGEKKRKA